MQAYAASFATFIPARQYRKQAQMNRLYRFLYILFLPRLPRLGPEDVGDTAEYCNRLARRDEAGSNPSGAWMWRIPTRLALRIRPFKTAKKIPQEILHRAA